MGADGKLKNKRALIIGGGTGLGYACAEAMIDGGAAVMLSGRRREVLETAVSRLSGRGPVFSSAGDAILPDDVKRVVADAIEKLGGLDTVVVSAGTSGRTAITSTEPTDFQRIMDQNILPVFLTCRFVAPHLVAQGSGSIIAISSMYGIVGQYERVAYCGAKSAVIGMIRAMALDLAASGVRANAICPGFVETELAREIAALEPDPELALRSRRAMHPIPRAGKPEEIGELAAFLASDAAAFMTGQFLAVDGGYSIR